MLQLLSLSHVTLCLLFYTLHFQSCRRQQIKAAKLRKVSLPKTDKPSKLRKVLLSKTDKPSAKIKQVSRLAKLPHILHTSHTHITSHIIINHHTHIKTSFGRFTPLNSRSSPHKPPEFPHPEIRSTTQTINKTQTKSPHSQ